MAALTNSSTPPPTSGSNINRHADVQKLKTITEKLRLEITALKEALQNEKCAVRALTIQQQRERRVYKTEMARKETAYKKQLSDVAHPRTRVETKQNGARIKNVTDANANKKCDECVKFAQDVKGLKDVNKELEERLQNATEADRSKANDLRTQHESHVTELARFQRITRLEIQKLLEELKTKDRLIGQLKRSLGGHVSEKSRTPLTIDMRKVRDNDRSQKQVNDVALQSEIELRTVAENDSHQTSIKVPPQNPEVESTVMPPGVSERLHGHIEADVHMLQEKIQNENLEPTAEDLISKENDRLEQVTVKHRKEMYYRPFMDLSPVVEEDTDSAVSSAPSSLSPQPYHHPTTLHHPSFSIIEGYNSPPPNNQNVTNFLPTSLSPQPSEGYTSPSPTNYPSSPASYPSSPQPPDVWYNNEQGQHFDELCPSKDQPDSTCGLLNTNNKGLESELAIAKRQVRELERALLVTREVKSGAANKQADAVNLALTERIRRLESREASLLADLQELREQNELQEFRILELEECHEKWSLRSQSSTELRDIDSSRVTPFPHDSIDCKGDVVREHLLTMTKKTTDPDDKHCLQQVLTLLENLETLSQEHANCLEDISGEFYSGKFIKNDPIPVKQSARIVATVLPFTDCGPHSIIETQNIKNEDDCIFKLSGLKKKQLSNSSSLQESGIFEGDSLEYNSVATQTNFISDMTLSGELKLSELTAEIQKLNQIRESIEEGKKCPKKLVVPVGTSKEIEFYKNRLNILESKINIYESSGDTQTRKLAERLNHEVMLTSQVKELSLKIEKYQQENLRLEEERCELEEAENDTRLRCQQLETELELISERLRDVEESRSANKRKAKDAKALATYWESMISKYEERNYELEEKEMELQCRLDNLEKFIPVLLAWNFWKTRSYNLAYNSLLPLEYKTENVVSRQTEDMIKTIESLRERCELAEKDKEKTEYNLKKLQEKYKVMLDEYKEFKLQKCSKCTDKRQNVDYIKKVQELLESNREFKKQIEQLEQRELAYIETLQQADNIWAEMETGYKKRISDAEESETKLRLKVRQFEENELKHRKASTLLNERIVELEDVERKLEGRIHHLEKENKYLSKENLQLNDQIINIKNEWKAVKDRLEGPVASEIDRQKKKLKELQEEVEISTKVLEDTEDSHQKEVSVLKLQLSKTNKELVHLDVTNSELKEEITNLETKIAELQTALLEQRINSDRIIKNLTSELTQRDRQCLFRKRSFGDGRTMSLREELVHNEISKSAPESTNDSLNLPLQITM